MIGVFDTMIEVLCKFDRDNFQFAEEIISVDGSHAQIIIPNKNINKTLDGVENTANPIEVATIGDLINFDYNVGGGSINIPILGVYSVTRKLPLTLELAETKNERQAFLDFLKNKSNQNFSIRLVQIP